MFIAGVIGVYQVVSKHGIDEMFLAADLKNATGTFYWALYIFYLSKFPELIDTVILVLKKVVFVD